MNILVIDDEPLVAKTLGRLLRPNDVQIIGSSIAALEIIEKGDFDLIFCDLVMPEMNGQELYLRACGLRPDLARQFVFITGGAIDAKSEEFLSSEAPQVLYKPFDRKSLLSVLMEAERLHRS